MVGLEEVVKWLQNGGLREGSTVYGSGGQLGYFPSRSGDLKGPNCIVWVVLSLLLE